MEDKLIYKGNPIDKKVEEILASWGSRQSSRRGFLTKVSKVAFGTVVGTTFSLGLPAGGGLLQKLEASDCTCNNTTFCGANGPMCCGCGGGIDSCPPGKTKTNGFWTACCSGSNFKYYDCCSPNLEICDGPNCEKGHGKYEGEMCGAMGLKYLCTIVVGTGTTC